MAGRPQEMPKSYSQTRDVVFSLFLTKFLREIYAKGAMTKESHSSLSLCLEAKGFSLLGGPEHMGLARGLLCAFLSF